MTLTSFDDEPDQEKRIERLREEIKKLSGNFSSIEEMPADVEEEFLKHVLEYETAQPITLFQLLENAGVQIPAPDGLDDATLPAELTEIIGRIGSLGAYLLHA